MRIAITGTTGTLGQALVRHAESAGYELLQLNRSDCDITDAVAVRRAMSAFGPDVVIHAAAYTDVEGAESKPAVAFATNSRGTRNVALACLEADAALIYISTNMVFFDETRKTPFTELEPPCPRGVYATSKREGEIHVQQLMSRFYIARVSWLYGMQGDSFVHKMVRLANEKGALIGVDDEVSTPTYAEDLADALLRLANTGLYGWYHMVNEGECSRYEYIKEIMRLSGREHIPITPGKLSNFSRAAPTPPYSTLLNVNGAQAGIVLRPWRDALADYISQAENLGTPG
ncbi:MAG TPA: dTDP-4-dehydrorhamnose reductase [Chloroflexia bacterium]|nr:dTDP-4-dehydrorhamnose reductase [Chloroflexia bacterium]